MTTLTRAMGERTKRRPGRRNIVRRINQRCWTLARRDFLRLREDLLADLAEGEIGLDQVDEWQPRNLS